MNHLQHSRLTKVQRVCICAGVGLLLIAAIMCAVTVVGVTELADFEFLGHSGLRTIAAVAVAGCLLSAVGTMDEFEETERD